MALHDIHDEVSRSNRLVGIFFSIILRAMSPTAEY